MHFLRTEYFLQGAAIFYAGSSAPLIYVLQPWLTVSVSQLVPSCESNCAETRIVPKPVPKSCPKCESGRPLPLPGATPRAPAHALAAMPRAANHHQPPVEKSSVARALAKQSWKNIQLSQEFFNLNTLSTVGFWTKMYHQLESPPLVNKFSLDSNLRLTGSSAFLT